MNEYGSFPQQPPDMTPTKAMIIGTIIAILPGFSEFFLEALAEGLMERAYPKPELRIVPDPSKRKRSA